MMAGVCVKGTGLWDQAMSRIAKPSPVSAKMYRHFAAITLIITAGLGFFASAENTQAVAEIAAKRAEKKSAKHQAPPRLAAASSNNLRDAREDTGGRDPGYDSGQGYADPDGTAMTGGSSRRMDSARSSFVRPVAISGGPGLRVPDAEKFELTPAEYERQRKLAKAKKGPPPPPDADQNGAMSKLPGARGVSNPDAY